MSIGIIRYPGSNCDYDTLRYFENSFFIWHKESQYPENMKLLIIPGGFAFGDRLYNNATEQFTIEPGVMALQSPVCKVIREAAKRNIPILGICNGFQILTQMELLPGKLILNKNKKFTCKQVSCTLHYNFPDLKYNEYNTNLYIANSFGKYDIDNDNYKELVNNKQIFLTYKNYSEVEEIESIYNIAGICNKNHNIFGMMPHPERNNNDFKPLLYKLLFPNEPISTQFIFHNKITELMHSEHISYKSTKRYLKSLYTQTEWVIQGPGENAGIVDIGEWILRCHTY